MRETALEDLRVIARNARALYDDDPAVARRLGGFDRRLHEPLRVALAGMVKAGKSTLLNALIGEPIAATDAGECTRIVTWYRYGDTPTITLHPYEGEPRRLPFRRIDGKVEIELGGTSADDVSRIDVAWPTQGLKSMIIIDTPGIASLSTEVSARSTSYLTQKATSVSADAVVYLLRHLHESDLHFLENVRGTASDAASVNAVAVLSRADEVGAARIDSLLSAGSVAQRYAVDADLRSLVLGVIPVAGLVAEAARTLRESEYRALAEIAGLERGDREKMLVSADRFVRLDGVISLGEQQRRELLSRFGLFGVRLSAALIRGGATDSSELASRLVQQSGLNALLAFLRTQFRARASTLKVQGVLPGLEAIIREHPREGSDELLAGLERIVANTHSLRELAALARSRTQDLGLPADALAEAARIIGGDGADVHARLALADDESPDAERVDALLGRWRGIAESPLTPRSAVELCHVVIRSLEQIAASERPVVVGAAADDIVSAR